MVTHIAWDLGAIAVAVRAVLGVEPVQKTTRTLCGRRVVMAHIDNQGATCPACVEEMALREAEAQVLREELGR